MNYLLFLLNGRGKSIPAAARFSFDQGHYSVNGEMQTFSDLFTTIRASLAWGVVEGAIEEYAINEPMLSSKGLGVWEAATNEVTFSNQFSSWLGVGYTESNVTSIGDSLGLTATQLVTDGTANRNKYRDAGTFSAGKETSYFIFENVDATESVVRLFDATATAEVARATLTWATGAVVAADGAAGTGSTGSAELLSASGPNGGAVYLVSLTVTPSNSGNNRRLYTYATGFSANTDTVILHHAQHCELAYVSPPILTDATAVTRNADVIVNNAAISSWYNESEGTFFVECNGVPNVQGGADRFIFSFDDGSSLNNATANFFQGGVTESIYARTAAVSTGGDAGFMPSVGGGMLVGMKYAFALGLNDSETVLNGAASASDTLITPPSGIDTLRIGVKIGGANQINGYIQQFKYYNTRLTQAELETITS